jgi:8-oxo-dGTP pyrophosphatase MutT (NUDIX family)/SAM-dependent methyltransferase
VDLLDFIKREIPPKPWAEGDNIPWNEPGFSQRMLREHLSQEHDAASRRSTIIDRQVAWIDQVVLGGKPSKILDLGCGPGLYASRLVKLGHTCTGIDYGPASIRYARETASQNGLTITYNEGDLRQADYGEGFDLVMLIYGEFNVFCRQDANLILAKAWEALKPFASLLLEAHTFEAVRGIGTEPGSWSAAPSGLFSDRPHLLLEEGFWDDTQQAATRRYFVVDGESGKLTRHAASYQAYSNDGYRSLLEENGFGKIIFYPSLTGFEEEATQNLMVIQAGKERKIRYQGAVVQGSRVLLIQHREHASGVFYWCLPGGGREEGESEEACVVRELSEETGLQVKVERLLCDEPEHPGGYYQRHRTYFCTILSGILQPGAEPEADAAALYSIAEASWFDLRDEDSWGDKIRSDPFTYPQMKGLRKILGFEVGEVI